MRTIVCAACLLLACGRSGPFDEADLPITIEAPSLPPAPAPRPRPAVQVSTDALLGVWVFGPMVEQGFAGTLGRLATLELAADGRFTMSYGIGCTGGFASGTWAVSGGALRLDVTGTWTTVAGEPLQLTTLVATPVGTALRLEGLATAGAVDQQWERGP